MAYARFGNRLGIFKGIPYPVKRLLNSEYSFLKADLEAVSPKDWHTRPYTLHNVQ
ncbi:Uncharacterized protein APZ42_015670 [Daphnia magna]|uniref:Uncharacterized protein n=1 Tax=Daphnia magna TaxID=35525 RepID=A0A0P6DQW6_9CRUS|nr:Uncharacterized protein APZ42_015670 [Daphnia magna]